MPALNRSLARLVPLGSRKKIRRERARDLYRALIDDDPGWWFESWYRNYGEEQAWQQLLDFVRNNRRRTTSSPDGSPRGARDGHTAVPEFT